MAQRKTRVGKCEKGEICPCRRGSLMVVGAVVGLCDEAHKKPRWHDHENHADAERLLAFGDRPPVISAIGV